MMNGLKGQVWVKGQGFLTHVVREKVRETERGGNGFEGVGAVCCWSLLGI